MRFGDAVYGGFGFVAIETIEYSEIVQLIKIVHELWYCTRNYIQGLCQKYCINTNL